MTYRYNIYTVLCKSHRHPFNIYTFLYLMFPLCFLYYFVSRKKKKLILGFQTFIPPQKGHQLKQSLQKLAALYRLHFYM